MTELRARPRRARTIPEDPFEDYLAAYLVKTETPESPHTVASPTPLLDSTPPTRHAEDSVDTDTSGARPTSSDFTTPLSPDHPLTHASPTLVPILRRTARMDMRVLHLRCTYRLSALVSKGGRLCLYLNVLRMMRRSDEDDEEEDDEEAGRGTEVMVGGRGSPQYESCESSFSRGCGCTWRVKQRAALVVETVVGELSPALFERYNRDIGELFTREALWHAISDTQMDNQELRLQIAKERRARLDLAKIVDSMRRGQEPRGDV
ncbi:hypothetical protein Tco_1230273 [Tanacetum coccineum]